MAGEGTYASVRKAIHIDTNHEVAIKIYNKIYNYIFHKQKWVQIKWEFEAICSKRNQRNVKYDEYTQTLSRECDEAIRCNRLGKPCLLDSSTL